MQNTPYRQKPQDTEETRKIQEQVGALVRRYPAFGTHVRYDSAEDGSPFCELILSNTENPACPLTVRVTDAGCFLSFGTLDGVTGTAPLTCAQMGDAIADVLADRAVFVAVYRDDDHRMMHKTSFWRAFAADDPALAKLILQLQKPIGFWERFFSPYRGIVEISTWSEREPRVFLRKK